MWFSTEKELLQYLKGRDEKWHSCKLKQLQFVEVKDDVPSNIPIELLEEYENVASGSGLYLRTAAFELPVAECALKSIRKSLGITGKALDKLPKKDVRLIYNKCAKCSGMKNVWLQSVDGYICYVGNKANGTLRELYQSAAENAKKGMWAFDGASYVSGKLVVRYRGDGCTENVSIN